MLWRRAWAGKFPVSTKEPWAREHLSSVRCLYLLLVLARGLWGCTWLTSWLLFFFFFKLLLKHTESSRQKTLKKNQTGLKQFVPIFQSTQKTVTWFSELAMSFLKSSGYQERRRAASFPRFPASRAPTRYLPAGRNMVPWDTGPWHACAWASMSKTWQISWLHWGLGVRWGW